MANILNTCGCSSSLLPLASDDCGLNVTLTCNQYVATVCQTCTYTVTLQNNTGETLQNVVCNIPLNNALAFLPGTLQINGETSSLECLEMIPVGELAPEESKTITYNVVVMNRQRYVKSTANVKFICCCCCMKRQVCVKSNINCLQVCGCCGNTNIGDIN